MPGRVLLVDDDPDICDLVVERLSRRQLSVTAKASAEEALPAALLEPFDLVIVDLKLPGMTGTEFCSRLSQSRPDLPVIVITAHGTMDTAVEALRAGAHDFIVKPIELNQLTLAVERTIATRHLREELQRLRQIVSERQGSDDLVGQSECMLDVKRQIQRVARSDATVLVTGESGTGKELIARAVHQWSARRDGPLVTVNCAALPEQLFESELFGHLRGAFTDAHSSRTGLFVTANNGTIFLDEVGEIPLPLQAKLLRVLQERRIRPVGSSTEVPIDVRVVAATNRDLSRLVEEGRFREDLYYRLNVINLHIPPLRARGNDVLLLAHHFIKRFAQAEGKNVTGMLSATAEHLLSYDWPGNVRELQNCIERAVALTEYDRLTVEDLPSVLHQRPRRALSFSTDDAEALPTLDEMERRYIEHVLGIVGGNKTMAARILGVDRRTLHRKFPAAGAPTPAHGVVPPRE
jgi:DNA-binding NtrC family response regulator